MLKDFKEFVMRGNVIDLAVAVIIGAAFIGVVNSFADDVLLQVIAAIFGQADFSQLSFALGDAEIYYGLFITALVNFLIVAFAVFMMIKGLSALNNLRKRDEAAAEIVITELDLLTEIRDALAEGKGPRT